MCLDLYVHWVSRSMHLTELKQSDWVISTLIINEFEKLDFQTHVFGYPNTRVWISKHAVFYRGIKVHPCDLNAGTQLVYHLMNY